MSPPPVKVLPALLIGGLLVLLASSGCFVVVVDANGNNSNPFLDGGLDSGLVLREETPSSLAVATRIDYIPCAH
jgi:hypothetical protein